jgi:hypothetical protein
MDPSQFKIIAEKPIGKGLDSFQEVFRSTCAQLGISASTDAIQQVVKNGENIEWIAKLLVIVRRRQRPAI